MQRLEPVVPELRDAVVGDGTCGLGVEGVHHG